MFKNFAAPVALKESISCLIGQNDVNRNHKPADFDVLITEKTHTVDLA